MGHEPRWRLADDADRVHRLLELSDSAAAGHGPVPRRDPASTRRLVEADSVYVLGDDIADMAMITITDEDPTVDGLEHFPPTGRPIYMRRLAVHPGYRDSMPLLAMQAVRQAMKVATQRRATAVRCETNPANAAIMRLLNLLGFEVCSPRLGSAEVPHVLLWREIEPSEPAAN